MGEVVKYNTSYEITLKDGSKKRLPRTSTYIRKNPKITEEKINEVIYYLNLPYRVPHTEISKLTGVSVYRIKQIEKKQ